MDTSQIRHPLHREGAIGATSTQGLYMSDREMSLGQNYNIYIYIYIIINYTPNRLFCNLVHNN